MIWLPSFLGGRWHICAHDDDSITKHDGMGDSKKTKQTNTNSPFLVLPPPLPSLLLSCCIPGLLDIVGCRIRITMFPAVTWLAGYDHHKHCFQASQLGTEGQKKT